MKKLNFNLFKFVLSAWLVFHLSVMIIMSNGASFFARSMGNVYRFYANQLNINTNWNFFSPDPAEVMYIKYTVYFLDDLGNDLQPSQDFFYPEDKGEGAFGLVQRRHFYLSRYLLLSEDRMENMFAPWVCRQHPGATHVAVQTISEKVTPLDEISQQEITTRSLRAEPVVAFKKEFRCSTP